MEECHDHPGLEAEHLGNLRCAGSELLDFRDKARGSGVSLAGDTSGEIEGTEEVPKEEEKSKKEDRKKKKRKASEESSPARKKKDKKERKQSRSSRRSVRAIEDGTPAVSPDSAPAPSSAKPRNSSRRDDKTAPIPSTSKESRKGQGQETPKLQEGGKPSRAPRSPSRSPPRRKKSPERRSEAGPSKPPGNWGLRLTPRQPDHPPPFWKRQASTSAKASSSWKRPKSKGVKQRERLQDIQTYGKCPIRKWEREQRGRR